uniref:PAS fold-3 domain-containing protein n=1 Tax=Amorphochlora amoebiformis TaxID=1561963 RepID=A0A7S0DHY4_9EUKA|mmetsp:Transcript_28936/g.46265  ORF Transcript_28936/g.46265 Transcript_28936/m.46265 type:complete len:243 (+) Transcript_28936:200-928(+)
MLYDAEERARGFDRSSIELKVSKRAFDCPEVDSFWGSGQDLKITTSAPSLENLSHSHAIKKRKVAKTEGGSSTPESECPDFVASVEWRMIRSEITKDLKVGEWAFDCSTLEMWWSQEIFGIFDLDPKTSKPTFAIYKKLLHPDDKDLVLFLFQRALEKGVPYEVSHRFTLADKKFKWARVKCRVQLDPSQNGVTKLFGTIQDITLWSKSVIDGKKSLNAFVQPKQGEEGGGGLTEDPTCVVC